MREKETTNVYAYVSCSSHDNMLTIIKYHNDTSAMLSYFNQTLAAIEGTILENNSHFLLEMSEDLAINMLSHTLAYNIDWLYSKVSKSEISIVKDNVLTILN